MSSSHQSSESSKDQEQSDSFEYRDSNHEVEELKTEEEKSSKIQDWNKTTKKGLIFDEDPIDPSQIQIDFDKEKKLIEFLEEKI